MAEANRHHILRFLIKALQILGSDGRVWRLGHGERPRRQAIGRTAS